METKFDDKITSLETLFRRHNWHLQLHSATQVSSPGKEVIPVTFKITGFTAKIRNDGSVIHFTQIARVIGCAYGLMLMVFLVVKVHIVQ